MLIRYNWQLMQIRKQAPKYFYRRWCTSREGQGEAAGLAWRRLGLMAVGGYT